MNVKSRNVWTVEEEAKLQELMKRRAAVYEESAEELREILEETMGVEVQDEMLGAFIRNARKLQDALGPFTGSLAGGKPEKTT